MRAPSEPAGLPGRRLAATDCCRPPCRPLLSQALLACSLTVAPVRWKPAWLQTEVSMIPGSLTLGEFEARRDEFAGKTIVTYCTV